MAVKSGSPYPTIATGTYLSCVLDEFGEAVTWGGSGQYGSDPPPAFPAGPYKNISCNHGYGLGVTTGGSVVSAGTPQSNNGQTAIPSGLNDVMVVSAGYRHALAVRENGAVVGWGSDSSGEATAPGTLDDAVKVVAGRDESLAMKADGSAVSWGYVANDVASTLSGVVDIGGYDETFIALLDDGTVLSWEKYGEGSDSAPAGLVDVVQVACGFDHYVALQADGTVVCWGENNRGQTDVPAGLADVVHIQAGGDQTIAVQSDGTVVMWGFDNQEQSTPPAGQKAMVPGEPDPISGSLSGAIRIGFTAIANHDPAPKGEITARIPIRFRGAAYQDWTQSVPLSELQELYFLVIEADGLEPIEIPISSWQATNQSEGRQKFLQAVIPAAADLMEDIEARAGGELAILKGYRLSDGAVRREEIIRTTFGQPRSDQGGTNFTVTVSGYSDGGSVSSGDRTLTGIRSISMSDGNPRVRCDIDLFLRPGMTVTAGEMTFRADYINYFVGRADKFCEVSQR
ncbi:RCC1 domain-containing protein [Marinobacter sp. M1N3S26]|uniref:RCC1 domain-containing protein n=1 Tax=Marinobacter sp. M1N3S26 TaxID=3382299 RepID=UPI00387AACCC